MIRPSRRREHPFTGTLDATHARFEYEVEWNVAVGNAASGLRLGLAGRVAAGGNDDG